MPPYKMKFFNEIFYPLYESKSFQAVTSKELCEYFKEKEGKSIDSDNMKKKYLNELRNNGLIGEEDSPDDKRQKVYYPLVDTTNDNDNHHQQQPNDDYKKGEEMSNYKKKDVFDNFLQYSRIALPNNCKDVPDDWLIFQVLTLAKYRNDIGLNAIAFLDKDGNTISVKEFIQNYEQSLTLSRYFKRRQFHNFCSKVFGNMQYTDKFDANQCQKLSNTCKFVQFDISKNNEL
jgi:hypothetical protein